MKPATISLYGKTYAANDRAMVESLFNPHGTCNGFYSVTPKGVYLLDQTKEKRAFLPFSEKCLFSTWRDNGRRYYMQGGLSSQDRRWIGEPESFSAARLGAAALAEQIQNPPA